MLFYLSEGEHTITMRVVMGELSPIIQSLYRDMEQLSDALLSITKLTGNDPDPNYDYQFFRYIPGLEGTLQELQASLEQKAARLLEISGVNNSMTSSFSSVAKQLQSLAEGSLLHRQKIQSAGIRPILAGRVVPEPAEPAAAAGTK